MNIRDIGLVQDVRPNKYRIFLHICMLTCHDKKYQIRENCHIAAMFTVKPVTEQEIVKFIKSFNIFGLLVHEFWEEPDYNLCGKEVYDVMTGRSYDAEMYKEHPPYLFLFEPKYTDSFLIFESEDILTSFLEEKESN